MDTDNILNSFHHDWFWTNEEETAVVCWKFKGIAWDATRTAHACMSTCCLEIQRRTCFNNSGHQTEWLPVCTNWHKQKAACDITAFVCVIIKWVWQVVFLLAASAASVPYSDSLVEFLRELMGRSGRGSGTSAVWDLTELIRLTSGLDVGMKEGVWGGAGLSFQIQDTSWPPGLWSDDRVRLSSQNEQAAPWRLCFLRAKNRILTLKSTYMSGK